MLCGWVPLIWKIKKRNEKKKGLIIESDDSDGDVDDNENSPLVFPGDELGSSSEEESESDSKDEVYIIYYTFDHILFVLLL